MRHYDLAILGAGSTAFAAALRAQELGKTVVMIEERILGGTCANRGCLPSKNLIEAAQLVHDAQHPRFPGLAGASLGVEFAALVRQKDDLVAAYREQKYHNLLDGAITVIEGHAAFVDARTIDVDSERVAADKILIATGSRPLLPPIEGLDRVPFLTSDLLTSGEAAELTELPRSLLIIGGGYIALELAQMFRRFGSAVTIIERSASLLSHGYEPELGPAITEVLGREGIVVLTSAQVDSVQVQDGQIVATIHVAGRHRQERAEQLLVAIGRRPNSDNIGLDRIGVKVDATGAIAVDRHLRTSVPTVFAAGDVIGGWMGSQMATPVGSHDGVIAAHNALSTERPREVDHRVVPRAIFIDPPVAVVGMTEAQALAAGHSCWCNSIPMTLVPRAGAVRRTTGFLKMVADAQSHEVLGVTMFGAGAAEVIHEAAMASRLHATLHDFIDLVHVYPTMAEALKIAALSRFKNPARLSCCAE